MSIKAILSDFSNTILFPADKNYHGKLNDLHKKLTQELGEYDFYKYFKFNNQLLEFYHSLKADYSLHIFTSGFIQDVPSSREVIDPIFDNIFSAERLGVDKTKSESYRVVANELGLKPSEILYIDDQEKYLQAAKEAGFITLLYHDFTKVKEGIEEIMNRN